MSKFFAVGSSSTEESDSSDEEVVQIQRPRVTVYDSSSEDDGRRVVLSEKDKRNEELLKIAKQLKNHKKIKDMARVLEDFESLLKVLDKAKKIVLQEGIPKLFIKCIVELESFVAECWDNVVERKRMSKQNSRSLSTLKQKLRKYIRDSCPEEVDNYKNSIDQENDVDGEGSDVPVEEVTKEDGVAKVTKSIEKKIAKSGDDDDLDADDSWSSDTESESSTDDEDYGGNPAARFLKRPEKEKDKDKTREKKKREVTQKRDDDATDQWTTVGKAVPEKVHLFPDGTKITFDLVKEKIGQLMSDSFGRKGIRFETLDLLVELLAVIKEHSMGACVQIKVLLGIIRAIFDVNTSGTNNMKMPMWLQCLQYVDELLTLADEHPEILIRSDILDEQEVLVLPPPGEEDAPETLQIYGSIVGMMDRLDEEFIKILQAADAHSNEYIERLKNEMVICNLLQKAQDYIEKPSTNSSEQDICRIYQCHLEHLYYKVDRDQLCEARVDEQAEETAVRAESMPPTPTRVLIDRLCHYIYRHDTSDRIRTRVVLYHIYHHALHDRWFQARDLMLMSHLQEAIQHADINLQILYNRTMVQLGLCAFRAGLISDAHHCLVDIQSSNRARDLLAQGISVQRAQQLSAEDEKRERQRHMPFHMHINLELLECVYLVASMLMEIPYLAAHETDARRRLISRNFHYVLLRSDRQSLVGPPENMREHIVEASKSMKIGDWQACADFIINEKMNGKIWNLLHNKSSVCAMIIAKIKEECLRTYLYTYSQVYDTISLVRLSQQFELPVNTVHSIVAKMILNLLLMASLDEPTQCIVMHRSEPSRIQVLGLQLADKLCALMDHNERIKDMKHGSSGQRSGRQDSTSNTGMGGGKRSQYMSGARRGTGRGYNRRGGQNRGRNNMSQRGYNRTQMAF